MTLASQFRQLIRVKPIQLVPLQLNFLDNRRDLGECNAARGTHVVLSIAERLRSMTCIHTRTRTYFVHSRGFGSTAVTYSLD